MYNYDEKMLIACVDQAYLNNGIDSSKVSMHEFDAMKERVRDEIYKRKGIWIEYRQYCIPDSLLK